MSCWICGIDGTVRGILAAVLCILMLAVSGCVVLPV
jgi:hypothetical protein